MLLDLVLALLAGALLLGVWHVGSTLVGHRLAFVRYKWSTSVPMCPDASLLGTHLNSIALGTNSCAKLLEWHRQLGKTIGWMWGYQRCVSTVDLDFIKQFIYDQPTAHLGRFSLNLPAQEIDKSIFFEKPEEWRPLRRVIAPAFTPARFRTENVEQELEVTIALLIGKIEKDLAEKPGQLFNVDDLVQRYMTSLVGRNFFKQNLVDFNDPDPYWVRITNEGVLTLQNHPLSRVPILFPATRKFIDWLMWHFSETGNVRRTFDGYVKTQTKLALEAKKRLNDLRRAQPSERVDADKLLMSDGTVFKRNMVDHITDQYLTGKITSDKYFDNVTFLMAAANRTASDCIVHTIYLLAAHQDVQDKTRAAVQVEAADAEYLDWVLKESLRLLPPASIGCSRTISKDLVTSDGHTIKAGTFVQTNAFVIHRLEEYWGEDAHEFRPERWQDTSNHHPVQFLSFGAGPRGCLGRQYAMHQMKALMTQLLIRYRLSCEPSAAAYRFKSPFWIFLIPEEDTEVRIEKL